MHLKDSLTGSLKPVVPQNVSIYACGITPYSSGHVGHARTYVVFDLLARVLRAQGHTVRLVRNITDIDDKIIAAAKAQGLAWHELSAHFSAENREMMLATGLAVPEEPKASDYLADMFWLIGQLEAQGLAYVASTGDVLYRVSAYQGTQLMPHQEGALRSEQGQTRVNSEGKEDVRDFALWKRTALAEPGFDSPWGWGRPGWHIECSAMIRALFGGSVTVHGGGVDLKFPHHQAEIMQSEPVFQRPLADIWMHNGSVTSDGQKMSKSLGNYVTWADALAKADALAPGLGGELLRIALLQAHWQKPLDWSDQLLETTKEDLRLLTKALSSVKPAEVTPFINELAHNLNTPGAFVWLKQKHKAGDLALVSAALGFLGVSVAQWAALPNAQPTLSPETVAALQAERAAARAARDWATADALRQQLLAHGIEVNDQATPH